MKRKSASKKSRKKTNVTKSIKALRGIGKQAQAIILFGISVLVLFLVCIPGENAWRFIHDFILGLFGYCSILWPTLMFYISAIFAFNKPEEINNYKIPLVCTVIFLFCIECYVFSLVSTPPPKEFLSHIKVIYVKSTKSLDAGIVGALIGAPLTYLIGITGMRVLNSISLFISLMFLTGISLENLLKSIFKGLIFLKNKAVNFKKSIIDNKNAAQNLEKNQNKILHQENNCTPDFAEKSEFKKATSNNQNGMQSEEIKKVTEAFIEKIKKENGSSEKSKAADKPDTVRNESQYKYPPLHFLNESHKVNEGLISKELNANGQMLVDTLNSFNVKTNIIDVSRGPAVTRYELQPASGVKISKITSLADDIALNLAASGVRIEAPIPGKAAVGVEIPNKVVSVVNMNELIASTVFRNSESKLTVVLGRDISGKVVVTDLGKMPHLLIAGSTGSGKSVCINSFIISLLYKASPEEVKMIMIDPKVVELGVYNGIPHLLVPVVTDPKKAKGALSWAVSEMLKRYKKFADNNVRDMHSYNLFVEKNKGVKDSEGNDLVKMYSIIIIIDELSDLMMAAPNEIEDSICRLAQMARAAGMHLVIATQRPSVDVITGIIKANIPSRIALAVSSQVDSRTILDMSGAEKLLGRGDMLFSPIGSLKPLRIQGCYVTDKEIENIINHIKCDQKNEYDNSIMDEIDKNAENEKQDSTDSQENTEVDSMMIEAIECVVAAGQASTSLLQRRLRLGYARAGRLIDEMEKMGIVGPHEGSKARQVLINRQQFLEMNLRQD